MKIKEAVLIMIFVLATGNICSAAGDLSVGGTIIVGPGGVKFPDNSVQSTAAFKAPTAMNDVTGSRALGATYLNPYGKPMFVSVSLIANNGVTSIAYTGSNPPTTEVARFGIVGATPGVSLFFVVLPGQYYKVVNGMSLVKWIEWY